MMILFLACMILSIQAKAEGSQATPEYRLKAALLYKLTRFVQWPEHVKIKGGKVFSMCILGENVFANALDALEKRKANGLPIEVSYFTQSEAIDKTCHLLFVSDSKRAFLSSILHNFQNVPTLTISDVENFAEYGGIIEFTRGKKKIGFKINLSQAKHAELVIAAPLLELATVIESTSGAGSHD